jgi:hypothetical protein
MLAMKQSFLKPYLLIKLVIVTLVTNGCLRNVSTINDLSPNTVVTSTINKNLRDIQIIVIKDINFSKDALSGEGLKKYFQQKLYKSFRSGTLLNIINEQQLANARNIDYSKIGVLKTTIRKYRKRIGSNIGADVPAAVAFSMDIKVENRAVWHAEFSWKDGDLITSIGSKKKAKWLDSSDALIAGIEHTVNKFVSDMQKDL